MINPFTPNRIVPLERFIGRTSLIERAFDHIYNRSSLSLWGGPGMGKSSLLSLLTDDEIWRLQGLNPSQAIIILLNCQTIQPFDVAQFWREIFKLIQAKTESYPNLQAEIETCLRQEMNTSDDFRKILKQIQSNDQFLLLLLDDYEYALKAHEHYTDKDINNFGSELRNIAYFSQQAQSISVILATSRLLNEISPKVLGVAPSKWYNQYYPILIEPFTDTEVEALFMGIPITSSLRQSIRDIADGNPALLHHAGYLIYDQLRQKNALNAESFIQNFLENTLYLFDAIWEVSTEEEQGLLMLLALYRLGGKIEKTSYSLRGLEAVFSYQEQSLIKLKQRGLLKIIPEDTTVNYGFASSLMEWYVIKQIGKSNPENLQKRERIFANLMSRQQLEVVRSAFNWIWQNKDKLSTIFQWSKNLF